MRRAGGAVFLVILVAALPTVVSLCELRCRAHPVAAAHTLPTACAGHTPRHEGKAPRSVPSEEQQGCARHVLLARGNGIGIEVQISRAFVVIVPPFGSFLVAPDQRVEGEKLASADLSPPFGRSSDILRL
ncbi:MAG TPA: hypothetical protein VGQ75_09710 [Thermoanaerobaculia bacterium]|jgi:hypothetical protein|nr:hypothetical protein [Thermoanaerobaculia bacterium]